MVSISMQIIVLRHSNTKTTFHYIRQQRIEKSTYGLMQDSLDILKKCNQYLSYFFLLNACLKLFSGSNIFDGCFLNT